MNLLEAMRYLAALEQHRHFGRAAQACHITQPALSNAIRALEVEFGVTIVKRGRQYEGFTDEGRHVLASAHRMLHERESLRQDLASAHARPVGALTIGAVPTAVPVAARFAARLQARHAGLRPAVRSISSLEIEQGIEALSLDLAFGYSERAQLQAPPPQVLPQFTEHYFLLRRASGPAGRGRIAAPITWREAAALPLCMLSREMHNRTIIDHAFTTAGVAVTPVIETNAVITLVLAVLAGEVCSVMPGALVAVALQFGELEAQPLLEPEVLTRIGLLVPAQPRLSLAQQAAIALAQDADWQLYLSGTTGALV